jgi:hypothetical protein
MMSIDEADVLDVPVLTRNGIVKAPASTFLRFLKCHDLGIGESAERELLLEIFLQPHSDILLINLSHLFGVIENGHAFAELQCQEKGMTDFVSDVWRTEIINETEDIGIDPLLINGDNVFDCTLLSA